MSEDPFDRLFEEAMDQAVKNKGDIPDPGESWKRVEAKLKRSRKRRNRLRVLPYVASSFLIGALLFNSPGLTKAFTPVFDSLIQVRDGVTRVMFGSEEAITGSLVPSLPPDEPEPSDNVSPELSDSAKQGVLIDSEIQQSVYDNWEEAAEAFPYPIPLKPNVPEGFDLKRADMYLSGPKAPAKQVAVTFTYMDSKEHVIFLSIELLNERTRVGTNYKEEDGHLSVQKLHGQDAYLFETKDGSSSFEFLSGNLYIALSGTVSANTLLLMAGAKD